MSIAWPPKAPGDTVDNEVLWDIEPETLAASAFTLLNAAGVTIVGQSFDGVTASVRLSGGYDGQTAILENEITTSDGDVLSVSIVQPIVEVTDSQTSGTTIFNLDFVQAIEEAYERCGLEVRSGYEMASARRSANLMFLEWANRGLNMWTFDERTLPLNLGDGRYTLGADVIDVMDVMLSSPNYDPSRRTSLRRVSNPTQMTRSVSTSPGSPSQFYLSRQRDAPVLNVWQIPEIAGYTVTYSFLRRIQDAGAYTNTPDLPARFLPVFIAGLAFYVAEKKRTDDPALIQRLEQRYEMAWVKASDEDRDKSTLRIVPGSAYRVGR